MKAALAPPATLGVVGGGQLGRMFAHAAQRMGFRVAVLCEDPGEPAAQVAELVIEAASDDLDGLRKLLVHAQAVTVEFENVSAAALRWLARRVPMNPGWRAVRVAQDRLREKGFLSAHDFPVARWWPLCHEQDLKRAAAALDGPRIVKTAAFGYDGKGQARANDVRGLSDAWKAVGRRRCVVEEVVPFATEVSCVVARGADGEVTVFPVFENQHRNHILDATVCPAPIGPVASADVRRIACDIAAALDVVGMLTVEFFLTAEGRPIVNELAPRPHNSAHLTIEACAASQFEQQVRALCGLPLGSTRLVQPAAMVNLLGDLYQDGPPDWAAALRGEPDVHLHLYGKPEARPGRKMGHMTLLDGDPGRALARLMAARAAVGPLKHA